MEYEFNQRQEIILSTILRFSMRSKSTVRQEELYSAIEKLGERLNIEFPHMLFNVDIGKLIELGYIRRNERNPKALELDEPGKQYLRDKSLGKEKSNILEGCVLDAQEQFQ